jgi:hypothetical protein
LILIFQEDIYKEKLFLMAVKSKALETEEYNFSGCGRHDRIIVGFTTTCAISAYHH